MVNVGTDIHTNIAGFVAAPRTFSTILMGLTGLILAQLQLASNLPTN
jgi:hypothetical protein